MHQLLQRAWAVLISKKLAVYLIISLTAATTMGTLVPQESYLTQTDVDNWLAAFPTIAPLVRLLGLYHFYNTWWYQAIAFIFGVNTLACTIEQIRVQWRKNQPVQLPAARILQLNNSGEIMVTGAPGQILDRVKAFLDTERFRVYMGKGSLHAVKNNWGRWGLPLFHVSLVIILFWAVLSLGFLSRGVIEITEGQTIQENHQAYRYLDEGRFFNEAHGNFLLTLQKLEVKYSSNGPPEDAEATMLFQTGNGIVQKQVLNKSQEGRFRGFNIYLGKMGYAPLLIVKDSSGKWIAGNFYNVSAVKDESGEYYQQKLEIPEAGMLVNVKLYPDIERKENYRDINAYSPVKPGMDIQVLDTVSAKGIDKTAAQTANNVAYEGTIKLGETVNLQNYSLEFPELRRYAELIVVRDPGVIVIFTGFWLAVVSLLVYYLFVPKEVWVTVEETGPGTCRLVVGGRSLRFKNLFAAEFRVYQDKLQTLMLKDDY